MAEGTEQYAQKLEEFLGMLNPELFEAEGVLHRIAEAVELEVPAEEVAAAEDLFGAQVNMERVEDLLLGVCGAVMSSFNPPVRGTNTEADEEEGDDSSKFDQMMKKFLPKFEASLDVMCESLNQMNAETASIELEQLEVVEGEQTLEARRALLFESIGHLSRNLAAIEQYISAPPEDQAEPVIELLYTPPPWSTPPQTPFYFEVREGDQVVDKIPVNIKGSYLIGRLPICDIVADDATCSRQHAVVQYRPGDPDPVTGVRSDEVYIYDLGSTSGTYVNGMPLQARAYYPLFKGDILQFGQYACAFVLRDGQEQGVDPPEGMAGAGSKAETSGADGGEEGGQQNDRPVEEEIGNRTALDILTKPLDPRSKDFDKNAYKQAMIQRYEQQQRENEELLRQRKEREAKGLPPENEIPYVPERPVGKKKKKKKKDKEDCVVC